MDTNTEQTYCLGGRHYSNTKNITECEKVDPKTNKVVKNIRGSFDIYGRNKPQVFTIYR